MYDNIPVLQVDLGDVDEATFLHVSDLHLGSEHTDVRMIEKMVAACVKNNVAMGIYGDVFEMLIKHSVGNVHESKMTADEAIDQAFYILRPAANAGLIKFIIRGNHDYRAVKETGIDPVKYLAHLLDVPYLGAEAFVNLKVGDYRHGTDRRRPVNYMLYAHHGTAGGSSGNKLNKLKDKQRLVVADIYVQGHTHEVMANRSVIYVPDSKNQSVVAREQLFINTGSCLDRGGYAINYGFPPLPKGWVPMFLNGREKKATALI